MFSSAPLHQSFDVLECATAGQRIEQLTTDPAINSQPHPEAFLTIAHTHWIGEQLKAELAAQQRAQQRAATAPTHLTDPARATTAPAPHPVTDTTTAQTGAPASVDKTPSPATWGCPWQ